MKLLTIINRLNNKCMELLNILYFSSLYFNKVIFSKNVRLHKNTEIDIEKKGKVRFGKNFFSRDGFCCRSVNGNIVIGDNVFFNNYCSVTALECITIGNDCLFGENVKIYDHDHIYNKSSLIRNSGFVTKPVSIGDNCWICSNVVILKGVSIGNNCVIGANSVVHENLEDNTLYLSSGLIKKISRDV